MMNMNESLNEKQWEIAHAIAQTLVKEETDVNELGKAIAYLRQAVNQNPSDAGSKFFKYLKTLVNNGRQIGHSGRTSDYYRSIDQVCSHYLQKQPINADTLLQILGWARRLMHYYKEAEPIGEFATSSLEPKASRQTEIAQIKQSQDFKLDQVIEAKIIKISGNKVTYEILGGIKLTEKEPKKASFLKEGQSVQVKVTALKEDGSLKNIKCVD
jgi:ribosomal protein S15P/S13E